MMNIVFCVAHLRALQTDCGEGSAGTFGDCLPTDVGCAFVSATFGTVQNWHKNWHATQKRPSIETEGQV